MSRTSSAWTTPPCCLFMCLPKETSAPTPTIESVNIERTCRRYRTVPLEAFVKGHLRVVWKATTKLFDGWFSWVPSKKDKKNLCQKNASKHPFCEQNEMFQVYFLPYILIR